MKKKVLAIMLTLLFYGFITLRLNIIVRAPSETVIFQDNFESYTVGTFPYEGGWTIVWNGMGDEYQVIIDSKYCSPTKSLQLWGTYGWSCHVERHFSSDAEVIGFEAYVMVEDCNPEQISATVGFWNRDMGPWGKYYATVEFAENGLIRASSFVEAVDIEPYVPDVWYKIKLILDRSANKFSVWVNDEIKASNINTAQTYDMDALQLASRLAEVQCYYDDVKVFEVPPWTGETIYIRADGSIDPPDAPIATYDNIT
ncbi:MAG: hypothetical protein QHH17_03330 [Candidatus Bathyarchaeota archaeon]|nr:hypothetical protein [Candidatus Bathyarchaeota archaeon]